MDPWTGRWSVDSAATDEDGSTIHKMAWTGVIIKDPTRVMSLIPNILTDID